MLCDSFQPSWDEQGRIASQPNLAMVCELRASVPDSFDGVCYLLPPRSCPCGALCGFSHILAQKSGASQSNSCSTASVAMTRKAGTSSQEMVSKRNGHLATICCQRQANLGPWFHVLFRRHVFEAARPDSLRTSKGKWHSVPFVAVLARSPSFSRGRRPLGDRAILCASVSLSCNSPARRVRTSTSRSSRVGISPTTRIRRW